MHYSWWSINNSSGTQAFAIGNDIVLVISVFGGSDDTRAGLGHLPLVKQQGHLAQNQLVWVKMYLQITINA